MSEDDIMCYRERDDSSMNEQNVSTRLKIQRKMLVATLPGLCILLAPKQAKVKVKNRARRGL